MSPPADPPPEAARRPAPSEAARRPAPPEAARRPAPRSRVVLTLAPTWRRCVAAWIDLTLILALCAPAWWLGVGLPARLFPPEAAFWPERLAELYAHHPRTLLAPLALPALVGWCWAALWPLLQRETPGKALLKLAVVDAAGHPLTPPRALLRACAYLASVASLGLGWTLGRISAERATLHDRLSQTHVVLTGAPAARALARHRPSP